VDALLDRWRDVLGPDAVPAGEALLARWDEPHRRYHDRRHLAEVLTALGDDAPAAVVLAAYWHDAVYDPTAADNEERSAALADDALHALDLGDDVVAEVVRLVLLTAGHDPAPDDAHGALLCDADLAVLAAGPDRYAEYAAGVRQEYAHYDDDAFRSGRAALLRDLVGRAALFTTPAGRSRWEAAARRNVEGELRGLAGPLP
jgi:predicted metal-dependent HD superfamily phosphohydrolase